ncbi:hypothetical protein [Micrococcus luteus]|uniref:hypothetical protein n=1 Tax=Micrococcus luteus TaxID=1270 RepID=UPI0023039BE2|nr:hypothetical protein [Micrococcus luteus]
MEHQEHPYLEDEHLHTALREAMRTVDELQDAKASSAAAAWYSTALTLRRFIRLPHCSFED